jgi:hypothetical protein
MSTTIIPVSGSFGAHKSQSVRSPGVPQSNALVQTAPTTTKRASWMRFANHYATWATAGRLPLNE